MVGAASVLGGLAVWVIAALLLGRILLAADLDLAREDAAASRAILGMGGWPRTQVSTQHLSSTCAQQADRRTSLTSRRIALLGGLRGLSGSSPDGCTTASLGFPALQHLMSLPLPRWRALRPGLLTSSVALQQRS